MKTASASILKTTVYIVISIFAAITIRIFLGEVYVISSSSMQGSLFKGDIIWVNKLAGGPRLPKSTDELPFLGKTVPMFRWSKTNYKMRGYKDIERFDIVLFQFPDDKSQQTLIKRCVGLPGETVQIINNHTYIESRRCKDLETYQMAFKMQVSAYLVSELRKLSIVPKFYEEGKKRLALFDMNSRNRFFRQNRVDVSQS
jgi:signal peptidase I